MGSSPPEEKFPQMKTLKLYIPRQLAAKSEICSSKRSQLQAATSENEAKILRAFIDKAPKGSNSTALKTPKGVSTRVEALMHRFHVPAGQYLPLKRPEFVPETPFQEASGVSKRNKISSALASDTSSRDDQGHNSIDFASIQPVGRLSVTKLITGQWCELQTFYDVYSGVAKRTTNAMALGSKHHLELENTTHKPVDISNLVNALREVELQMVEDVDSESDDEQRYLAESKLAIFKGKGPENELAWLWLKDITAKIFELLTLGEAREVLAHGYVNELSDEYKRPTKEVTLNQQDILVSGIIDQLHIDADMSKILEITRTYPLIGHDKYKVDLSDFVNRARSKIENVLLQSTIEVCDVKTRKSKTIPLQNSVLEGAKLQVAHYRKMLEVLAEDPEATYIMLLRNAQSRGLDVDQPIGALKAIEMARVHGDIVIRDFERLAKGEPIGVPIYDNFNHPNEQYSMEGVLQAQLHEVEGEHFDYDILKTANFVRGIWVTPLTLRYFAARAAQFYSLIGPLLGDKTLVEYHNVKEQGTGSIIAKVDYEYNPDVLAESLRSSMEFWTGARDPEPADLLLKCKYCEFLEKCTIPRPKVEKSFREGLYRLIQD